ncbi:MAG: hypothetical protein LUO93_05715, partial [Methanomicrobiales archaeon]|nr:hypothetical protein [Methanomicrobiales archaeon]
EKDFTMPYIKRRVHHFGFKLPAVIWGFLTLIPALLLRKYDTYIITSPPESLLFTGFILQRLGRKVIIDMRDAIDREKQPHKSLTGIYRYLYNRLRNIIVSSKVVDCTKPIVYHGYDEIYRSERALDPPVRYNCRVNYETYVLLLRHGFVKDFSGKPENYGASSYHTIVHLGYDVNKTLSTDEYGLHSWQEGAETIKKIISDT